MASVNETLRDEAIRHAVDLHRYSNGVVRRILGLLNRTDADLFAKLTAALEGLSPSAFTVDRLEQLLYSVRLLNLQVYEHVEKELSAELRDFVAYEAGYQHEVFVSTIPPGVVAQVDIATVSVEQTYAAALARPFQGRLLKEWASSIEADRMVRIRDEVRKGYVENQTTSEIVQRVRGTRAKGYSDGVIEIDRRNAESVVRTAISHTAGVTRDRFMGANGDLVKAISWTATLDNRTSSTCRIRDGKRYTNDDAHKPIGHKIPWEAGPGRIHWNCRSCGIPVLKSFRELGIPIDELPPSERASMDGQVPADTTYGAWLRKQSAARQDEVLGPTRAAEFRDGKPLEKFYNDKGTFLTLDELRERDGAAFRRAGV